MKISNVNFINFRNLENNSIDLSGKINVFYGKNAQGKTSLLEAVYYSATGISFKTKKTIIIVISIFIFIPPKPLFYYVDHIFH